MWIILLYVLIFFVVLLVVPNLLFSWLRTSRPVVSWNQLRTGDILYTSAPGPAGYLFSLAGIRGGHAMLVVKDDDDGEVNILEISGYRDNPEAEAKPCIRKLHKRFECDYDLFGSVWRYQGPHIPSSKIHEFLEKVKDYKFNYSFVGEHLKQRFLGTKRRLDRERLCCSELAYMALVHAGVLRYDEADWADSFRCLMKLPGYTEVHDLLLPNE
jgi:hypothetical protein